MPTVLRAVSFQPAQHRTSLPIGPSDAALAGALADLGVPRNLLDEWARSVASRPRETDTTDELTDRIAEVLQTVARSPQPAAGSVIAVVGNGRDALRLARRFSDELGIFDDAVFVASPSRRPSWLSPRQWIDESGALASKLQLERPGSSDGSGTTVLVLCAPTGTDGVTWAREMLHAARTATRAGGQTMQTWAVVDAARKPEDIRAWADRLHGIDALGVSGLRDSVSPAAVLSCAIPVGRLDQHPASALSWALYLSDRLRSERVFPSGPFDETTPVSARARLGVA